MQFVNPSIDFDVGICLGNVWEGLAEFPEPYETLPSWPARDDDIECGQGDTDEPKTTEALPGTSGGGEGGHRLQFLWCLSLTKIHLVHAVLPDLTGCWG